MAGGFRQAVVFRGGVSVWISSFDRKQTITGMISVKEIEFLKMVEKIGKVKLRGGIFGKATWAVIVICVCCSCIALAAGNIYLDAVTLVLVLVFGSYFLSRLLQFAEQNPLIAILDGSEFVAHERIVQAAKYQGALPTQPNAIDHVQPDINNALIEADETQESQKIEGQ